MSKLRTHVQAWVDERTAEDYLGVLDDLSEHGCQSGMVGHLIYYVDTVAFYEEHQVEIDDLLYEFCDDIGQSPQALFGDSWDNSDPLARGDMNKNLLAWFGFEETARRISDEGEG